MRFMKVVKLRGGLQWLKDKQVYRSRRVLIGDEIALMGKKALTRETGPGFAPRPSGYVSGICKSSSG
jgi:hypothetical protein